MGWADFDLDGEAVDAGYAKLRGLNQVMMDMYDNPELIHSLQEALVALDLFQLRLERVVVKGPVGQGDLSERLLAADDQAAALSALVNLGYGQGEAASAVAAGWSWTTRARPARARPRSRPRPSGG